jgi:hypothetical protein
MSMARKALQEVGRLAPRSRMPSTGRPVAPGSGRQTATNDPRPVPGRPTARAMTPAPVGPSSGAPGHPARWVAGAPHLAHPALITNRHRKT